MLAISLPPRHLLIQKLFWTILGLCCITFALSMVMIGWSSAQISPASSAATAIYAITLLFSNSRWQARSRDSSSAIHAAVEDPHQGAASCAAQAPPACHAATISLAIFLSMAWTAAFSMSLVIVTFPESGFELGNTPIPLHHNRLPASYIEIAFMLVQIAILIWTAVLCGKERSAYRSRSSDSAPTHDATVPPASPQSRTVRYLIWASYPLCITALALSMYNVLGVTSLFLAPIAAVLSLILITTLVILTERERKADFRVAGPGPSASKLPCTSRLPAIISGFLLAALWFAAMGISITVASAGQHLLSYMYYSTLIAEPVFSGLSALSILALSIFCTAQRQALRAQNQHRSSKGAPEKA